MISLREIASKYLREIIYGGNDGIVTTFAVVAGFSGANIGDVGQLSFATVLLFGLANLFADATSMGLGNFLSSKANQDNFKSKKEELIKLMSLNTEEMERASIEVLTKQGFNKEDAQKLLASYKENHTFWADFLLKYKYEVTNPETEKPLLTGLATFFSFMLFGSIPLMPYLLGSSSFASQNFLFSCIATFSALFILGVLRWRISERSFLPSVIEVIFIGGLAAVVAYTVGVLFKEVL